MTLTSTTNKVQYSGDASTTSFAISFIYWDDTDVLVTLRSSAGAETTWTDGTQYTISGGSGATGTLTVKTSPTDYTPASGETLTIKSSRANTQSLSLPGGGALPSASIEQAFDQLTRLVQQAVEADSRQLSYPVTDAVSLSAEIPNSADRASGRLAFDASGEPIIVTTDVTGVAATAAGAALMDDADAAAQRVTMGAAGLTDSNTFTKTQIWTKGADIASASPLVLGTDGNYFDVTGTTGFSQITVTGGTFFMLQFDGALTMTDGANLDLGGGNITTAAGDRGVFFAVAANTAQLVSWAEEGNIVPVKQATQAAIEAETNENTYIPPDLIKHSPGVAKAWINFDVAGVDSASQNVTSITDTGAGDWTVNIATDFSSVNYVATFKSEMSSIADLADHLGAIAAGTCRCIVGGASLAETNVIGLHWAAFGDQA